MRVNFSGGGSLGAALRGGAVAGRGTGGVGQMRGGADAGRADEQGLR